MLIDGTTVLIDGTTVLIDGTTVLIDGTTLAILSGLTWELYLSVNAM